MPAFNEEEVIVAAVTRVRDALERLSSDSEIIVDHDDSTARTGERLDALAADGRLRVIHVPENRGYGWALRAGFAVATRPLLFFVDSDDQFEPMDLGRLLPLIDEADIVIGYRAARGDGTVRGALSSGYNAVARALLNVHARDINCAFKLLRREALARLALVSTSYTINVEIIARAAQAKLRVREVPVSHRPRPAGRSKVGISDVPSSFAALLTLRRALRDTPPT